MFTSLWKNTIKDTDEQPGEEICWVRSGMVLSRGASSPWSWGVIPSQWCVLAWKFSEPPTVGIFMAASSLKVKVKVKSLSRVWLFATPWTVTFRDHLSMGFSRQQYWSGLPFPSPGDLPDPGIEPWYPALWADALPSEPPGHNQLLTPFPAPTPSLEDRVGVELNFLSF